MTALATELDVRGLSEDDMAAMYGTASDAARDAILAEMARRDRAERDRQRRDAERAEWESGAYAQYVDAERECNGNLVSRRGVAASITDAWQLWSGPEHVALAYATEELRNYWLANPRITVTGYRDQAASGRRIQRDERDRDAAGAVPATPAEETVVSVASGAERAAARLDRTAERADRMAAARQRVQARVVQVRADMETGRGLAVPPQAPVATRPPQVDGAQVLGYASALLRRYARFPSQAALDAAVLWAAHAHARDASGVLVWDATPRLMYLSSGPGSGKSRALELTGMLCPAVFGLDTEPTEAGLVYTISGERATVLLDEGDVLFGSGKRKAGIRAVLNAGYTREGTVLRMRGSTGTRARVFGAVALAGLDVMKSATGDSLAPLFSRSIVIRMRKSADPVPRLDREAREVGAMLRAALGSWVGSLRGELGSACPEIPDGIANRSEEIWTPLLAIAEAAGGDWPERARRACEELALCADTSEDETADVMTSLAEVPWLS